MRFKGVLKFYPIILVIGGFVFFYFRGKKNDDRFYKGVANARITSCSKWQGRTTEYYLDNGLEIDITVVNNFDIQIGDSIVKKANSWYFDTYRKDGAGYIFYKTYNYSLSP